MNLGDYLKEAAGRRWDPGTHDCTAWPARWAGVELPRYSTDEEGQALIAYAGGLLPLWEGAIGERFRRVDEPEEGDVGIIAAIAADHKVTAVGAIFTGKRWAFVTARGLVCASATPLAVWRL